MHRQVVKLLLCAGVGLIAFRSLLPQSSVESSSPVEQLRKALNADVRTTYTCIKTVSRWDSRRGDVRVRKDQAATGSSATYVLAPTSMQGRITVDDGKLWSTYNPDKKTLYVQESPVRMLNREEFDRRISLMQQNYKVSGFKSSPVANRKVVGVQVDPIAKDDLYKRSFWVDADRSVILRVAWTHPNGTKKTISDTISIEFPEKLDENAFKLKLLENPKMVRIQSPRTERTVSSLSKHVGFDVLMPSEMPLGFLFTRAEAVTGATRTMSALRFTDGVANVTIYQSPAQSGKPPWRVDEDRGDFEHDGTYFAIEGDVPDAARVKIAVSVRETSKETEKNLRQRAVKQLGASEKIVGELRDLGLRFSDVAACIYLGKNDAKQVFSAAWSFKKGRSLAEIAQKFGVRESDVRKVVKSFWNNN